MHIWTFEHHRKTIFYSVYVQYSHPQQFATRPGKFQQSFDKKYLISTAKLCSICDRGSVQIDTSVVWLLEPATRDTQPYTYSEYWIKDK